MVHFGCLVIQPLEVPIGPLKGHFRLDAEGDRGELLSLGRGRGGEGKCQSSRDLGSTVFSQYRLPPASPSMYVLRVKAIFPNKIHTYNFQINQSNDDVCISSVSRNGTINPTQCYKLNLVTIPEIHYPSSFLKHTALSR